MVTILHFFKQSKKKFDPWHPDFKNFEGLKGSSLQGKQFFRLFAIFVLCLSIGITAYIEWSCYQAKEKLGLLTQQASKLNGPNQNYLKQSSQFLKIGDEISIIDQFCKPTADWFSILLSIFQNKPESTAFSTVGLRWIAPVKATSKKKGSDAKLQIRITGNIKGEADLSLQILENYKETMRNAAIFKGRLLSLELPKITRQDALGLVNFEMLISLDIQPSKS